MNETQCIAYMILKNIFILKLELQGKIIEEKFFIFQKKRGENQIIFDGKNFIFEKNIFI